MKNLAFFLLGLVVATGFWFAMGYIQVDGNKIDEYLHRDGDAAAEEVVDELQSDKVVDALTQPDIVGQWHLANPLNHNEENRMLLINEYGVMKDYECVLFDHPDEYDYIIEGDVLKYKHSYSSTYRDSFRFKVSTQDGKDYLEIFGNADFGGKWVRSK